MHGSPDEVDDVLLEHRFPERHADADEALGEQRDEDEAVQPLRRTDVSPLNLEDLS